MNLPDRPHALLLDAGNTLVFLDTHAVATLLAEASSSHVPTPEALLSALPHAMHDYEQALQQGQSHTTGWPVFMTALLVNAGLASPRAEELVPWLWKKHLERNLWRRVPDDVRSGLVALQSCGIRLGVISNSEGHIKALLTQLDLAHHFEVIVDSGVEGVRKSDPAIFQFALERMGVRADNAVYVGDLPEVDVLAARAAGLQGVLNDRFDLFPHSELPRIRTLGELAHAWTST